MKLRTILLCLFLCMPAIAASAFDRIFVEVDLETAYERSALVRLGFAIDGVDLHQGRGYVVTDLDGFRRIQNAGFEASILSVAQPKGWDGYHDEGEVDQTLNDLTTDYPDLTHRFSIGTTLQGRPIDCLKISDNPEIEENEPGIFIVARHHAREPLTTELALETAKRFLANYDTSEYIKHLVDEYEIYIVPRLNADGATYDEQEGFGFWRKNRRENPDQDPACWGVDANRNYSYGYGLNSGSSGSPCEELYRGRQAFSEPITAAVRDFVLARTNITTLVTLHTYGELILYPWSHTDSGIPDPTDLAIFSTAAYVFSTFNGYAPMPGSLLYLGSGDLIDWSYGAAGVFGYTFELSPTDPWGFYPDDTTFGSVFDDNWPALVFGTATSKNPEMVLSCDLWKFQIDSDEATASLTWAPIVETDGDGYDVLRAKTEAGTYEKVNAAIIELGSESYLFTDTPAREEGPVTYYYKVRYNSTTGHDQEFGPLSADFEKAESDDDDMANDDDAVEDDDAGGDDDAAIRMPEDLDNSANCCG